MLCFFNLDCFHISVDTGFLKTKAFTLGYEKGGANQAPTHF